MKRIAVVMAAALALALSFALVGCGGGEKDHSGKFQGSWKVASMSGVSEDEMALMEAFSLTVVLDLNEDKSASLNMMGEEMTGTWEAKSAEECSVTFDGETVVGKLAGDKLTLAVEGEEMTFAKISAEEAATLKANSLASSGSLDGGGDEVDASFAPVVVADDDVCQIEVTGKKADSWGDCGYTLDITNKSDAPIYVTVPFDSSSVAGVMVDFWGGATVQAGKSATDVFVYADSEKVKSLADLKNVEMTVEVWNDDTFDTLGSYRVTLG